MPQRVALPIVLLFLQDTFTLTGFDLRKKVCSNKELKLSANTTISDDINFHALQHFFFCIWTLEDLNNNNVG